MYTTDDRDYPLQMGPYLHQTRPARRGRQRRLHPPPSERELDTMAALWQLGGGTVAAVREVMLRRNESEPAYTTVLTFLQRLTAKGWVVARRYDSRNYYAPAVSIELARRDHWQRTLEQLYGERSEALLLDVTARGPYTRRGLREARANLAEALRRKRTLVPAAAARRAA